VPDLGGARAFLARLARRRDDAEVGRRDRRLRRGIAVGEDRSTTEEVIAA